MYQKAGIVLDKHNSRLEFINHLGEKMNTDVTRDQNSYETKRDMLQEITDLKNQITELCDAFSNLKDDFFRVRKERDILKEQLAISKSETIDVGEWYNQSLIREEDLKEDMLELQTKLDESEKDNASLRTMLENARKDSYYAQGIKI